MTQFSIEKIAKANRSTVYDVFSNFENYEKIVPQHFPSIRIRSVRDNTAVVEEHMYLGEKELVIMAKHVSEEPVLHEVFIIGGDAKGTHIKQQFVEIPEGTKIIVDFNLKLKGKMKLSSVFGKSKYEQDYDKILDDFVNCAEN